MDKETKRVVKDATRRGWTLTLGSKHYILLHPCGRKVSISMSPSCGHAYKHVQRDLERAEREIAGGKPHRRAER